MLRRPSPVPTPPMGPRSRTDRRATRMRAETPPKPRCLTRAVPSAPPTRAASATRCIQLPCASRREARAIRRGSELPLRRRGAQVEGLVAISAVRRLPCVGERDRDPVRGERRRTDVVRARRAGHRGQARSRRLGLRSTRDPHGHQGPVEPARPAVRAFLFRRQLRRRGHAFSRLRLVPDWRCVLGRRKVLPAAPGE